MRSLDDTASMSDEHNEMTSSLIVQVMSQYRPIILMSSDNANHSVVAPPSSDTCIPCLPIRIIGYKKED